MRKLIVHRKGTFVACLGRYFIYALDEVNGDTQIKGCPCKLIGAIRNGKTVEVEIPETGCIVYITASKMMANEYSKPVTFPAGTEPVELYLKAQLNPIEGNMPMISRNADMSESF